MLRRSIKNATKNFAPCERDVRDATSNDKSMASVTVGRRCTMLFFVESVHAFHPSRVSHAVLPFPCLLFPFG